MRSLASVAIAAVALAASSIAVADSACRLVEINFQPAAHLQLAVWIEDAQGNYVDTAYVTRSTGALGLGNRPGNGAFKSAYRWPYGRREMVLPVWAHKRNQLYPYVVMGGGQGVDAHDDSIGYHEAYSSTESFYCPPSNLPLDAVSCASPFVGSKGLYAAGRTSFYPPRADLTTFGSFDSSDARDFVRINDLVAISGATPPGGRLIDPDIRWAVPSTVPDGQYVVRVEASLEADFNDAHRHPSFPDINQELRGFGRDALGQPSVVYSVPIALDGTPAITTTNSAVGYGDWDGATGTMHPLDASISTSAGSGVGRLDSVTDADGTWRVKVFAASCEGCRTPAPAADFAADPNDTSMKLTFTAPPSTDLLDKARRYEIRYQPKTPLDDSNFASGIPADMAPAPGAAGQPQSATLTGLKAETLYYVGIRAINACGQPSTGVFTSAVTLKQKFVVLHGCFIATAAYGSAMQSDVDLLRRFRDGALLGSPLGRLAVAAYYALSPPLARAIATDERLRAAARQALRPAVALARGWLLSEHRAR
ncbi:MAG: Fibronectin type domain protein [Myxococcales bacterium]|nr:Fibronectin type domain protein [Myxococcales bacterium]